MRRIEEYAKLAIDTAWRYFGSRTDGYGDEVVRAYAPRELAAAFEREDPLDVRFFYLTEYLGEESLTLALHLAIAAYLYPSFAKFLRELTGAGVTLSLAEQIAARESEREAADIEKSAAKAQTGTGTVAGTGAETRYEGYLRLSKVLCEEGADEDAYFAHRRLSADEALLSYLEGAELLPAALNGLASLYTGGEETRVYGMEEELAALSDAFSGVLDKGGRFAIQLAGVAGSGKKTLVRAAADKYDATILFLNYRRLLLLNEESRTQVYRLAVRLLVLYDAGLCLHGITEKDAEEDASPSFSLGEALYRIDRFFSDVGRPLILCTDEKTQIIPATGRPFLRIVLGSGRLTERAAVWRGFAKEYKASLSAPYYASKYRLSPGQIRKIFTELGREDISAFSEEALEKKIYRASLHVIDRPELGEIIARESVPLLSSLMLPKEQLTLLSNICAYIRMGYRVFEEWRLSDVVSYGRGMTALFTGRPGTGKTMAAECIAGELGLPLYRINLSQVIDKYIGETEKKLEKVFAYAQVSNVLLFFDEADALFGKRSEVKDSKDKYANAEVAYILQRIEQYDGAVILSTNLIGNIDEAFMRRMKFVVDFPIPEKEVRLALWQASFPKETPLKDVDVEYLAERIELSGGHIKNIVTGALFLAAQYGTEVTMREVLHAAKREFLKLGKVVTAEYFGRYEKLLLEDDIAPERK